MNWDLLADYEFLLLSGGGVYPFPGKRAPLPGHTGCRQTTRTCQKPSRQSPGRATGDWALACSLWPQPRTSCPTQHHLLPALFFEAARGPRWGPGAATQGALAKLGSQVTGGAGNKRSRQHASPGHPAASSPPSTLTSSFSGVSSSSSPPSLIGRNWLFQNRNFHSEPKQACYLDLSRENAAELWALWGGGAPEEQSTHIHPRRLLTKSSKLLGRTETISFPICSSSRGASRWRGKDSPRKGWSKLEPGLTREDKATSTTLLPKPTSKNCFWNYYIPLMQTFLKWTFSDVMGKAGKVWNKE